jgi:hypothetical protein
MKASRSRRVGEGDGSGTTARALGRGRARLLRNPRDRDRMPGERGRRAMEDPFKVEASDGAVQVETPPVLTVQQARDLAQALLAAADEASPEPRY